VIRLAPTYGLVILMFGLIVVFSILLLTVAMPAFADAVSDAMADVDKYAGQKTVWDGPTTSPVAAGVIGWTVNVLDGAGSVQVRAAAFGQALALKPDGIVINGFDAVEQQAALEQAKAAGIPMVAWHAGPVIGPDAASGLYASISTDAMEVSAATAKWAFADAGGKPGVVIFTDSTYAIAFAEGAGAAMSAPALSWLLSRAQRRLTTPPRGRHPCAERQAGCDDGYLLIHTGGTIGMVPGPQGLTPAADVAEAACG